MSELRAARSRKKEAALVFAAAALAVMAFHALLFALFTPAAPRREPPPAPKQKTIMLNQNIRNVSGHRGIFMAMEYGNPELFAKPDASLGFGSLIPDKKFAQPLAEAEPPMPRASADFRLSGFDSPRAMEIAGKIIRGVFFSSSPAEPSPPPRPAGKFPRWFVNGKETDIPSGGAAPALSAEKIMACSPSSGTVFTVSAPFPDFEGGMPSLRVVQSSGAPELDVLSETAFLRFWTARGQGSPPVGGETNVRVEWRETER
jgi:hypothetical protein